VGEPQRRTQRRTHLDASVVPVERALLARAQVLESGADDDNAEPAWPFLAAEFRELAEELHYW
jgi:hypothetical protein